MYTSCSQATVVLTSKHFAQRQPWSHCVAATLRSTAAVSNWSWMSLLLFWGLVTSARPWGQLSQPPRGPWLPRAEPCPPSSGPYWPTLSLWCWKLCSESFPMLSVLTGMTNMVGIWDPMHSLIGKICFHFPTAVCSFSHLTDCFPLPCHLFHLLVCFTLLLFCSISLFDYLIDLSPTLLPNNFVSLSHTGRKVCGGNNPPDNAGVIAQRLANQSSWFHISNPTPT